ncbi:uncharacterized protein LOC107265178 [Cephus cinctus]|uniref:Uncharacterized protein LOC107265178 n=1 Tax=Cephus cinctus TaxID=211228 RepID=A0AAJ7FFW8_CEPCN|nr:uncharacterized protein LOC107265178 [Cephus cinctus]
MDLENCTKNLENSLEVKPTSKDASNCNFHVGEFQTLLTNELNDMEPTMNRLIDKHNCSSEIDMKGNGTLNINDGKLDQNMNVNGPLIGVTAPDVLHPYFVTVKHNTTKLPVELDAPNEFTISRKRSIQALCLEIIPLKRKRYIRDTNSLSNNCERLSKGDAVLNLEKNLNQFNINDDEVTMTNNEMENLENRQLNTASKA